MKKLFRCVYPLGVLGALLFLSACTEMGPVEGGPTLASLYTVDPLLREYYQQLGGEERLGAVISPLYMQDSLSCQFTTNALLCLNAAASGLDRYYLDPIGVRLNIYDPPGIQPGLNSPRQVDGYEIYPDFIPLYDAMQGALNAGRPLSQVRYNYESQRVEQFFEKLGFYHRFDEAPGVAHLMPYGAIACDASCPSQAEGSFIVQNQKNQTPFAPFLERLGGLQVFGDPLTDPYLSADGYTEQVYETVVLFAPPSDLTQVNLRPLPALVGKASQNAVVKSYGPADGMVFFPTSGELGFHIPMIFDQFILQHGGYGFSGVPVWEVRNDSDDNNIIRQCFEKYCLDYHGDDNTGMQVRLAPLGMLYLQVNPQLSASIVYTPVMLEFVAGEEKTQISPNEQQVINLLVYQSGTHAPAANVEAVVSVWNPDGTVSAYNFPPTGAEGHSSLVLPPYPGASNGTVVAYQVCLNATTVVNKCSASSFLLWQNP